VTNNGVGKGSAELVGGADHEKIKTDW